ncbi:MAG: hypothetical protein JO057_12255 [Chloroflexi bacterium]|nr:hypothetical protein [Chloroflexota bacterium]
MGLATTIVASMGTANFAPVWVGLVLIALGIAATGVAVSLWRQYLVELHEH